MKFRILIDLEVNINSDFNQKVNEENAILVENINLMNNELPEMLLKGRDYYAELKRMEELSNSLIFFNEKFSSIYKNFMEKYFSNYDIKKLKNNDINSFKSDLNLLKNICSEYSKVRKLNVNRL